MTTQPAAPPTDPTAPDPDGPLAAEWSHILGPGATVYLGSGDRLHITMDRDYARALAAQMREARQLVGHAERMRRTLRVVEVMAGWRDAGDREPWSGHRTDRWLWGIWQRLLAACRPHIPLGEGWASAQPLDDLEVALTVTARGHRVLAALQPAEIITVPARPSPADEVAGWTAS